MWTFDGPFTVGRVPPADVVLDDARVSRQHLLIAPGEDGWWVEDLQRQRHAGRRRVERPGRAARRAGRGNKSSTCPALGRRRPRRRPGPPASTGRGPARPRRPVPPARRGRRGVPPVASLAEASSSRPPDAEDAAPLDEAPADGDAGAGGAVAAPGRGRGGQRGRAVLRRRRGALLRRRRGRRRRTRSVSAAYEDFQQAQETAQKKERCGTGPSCSACSPSVAAAHAASSSAGSTSSGPRPRICSTS